MNSPGNQLFTRPALANDEHGGMICRRRNRADEFIDLLHPPTFSDQLVSIRVLCLKRQVRRSFERRTLCTREHPSNNFSNFYNIQRLCKVVKSPELYGLDCRLHGPVSGDHDDRNYCISRLHLLQSLKPVKPRH